LVLRSLVVGLWRLVAAAGLMCCCCWWLAGSASATTGHAFAGRFGGQGTGDGQFNEGGGNGPPGLAVMPSTGQVFTAGGEVGRVQRFSNAGVFESVFTADVAFSYAVALAVDPAGAGAVYELGSGNVGLGVPGLLKYSAAGVFAYQLDFSATGTAISGDSAVAVDPVDGTVYVSAMVTDPSSPSLGAPVIDRFDNTGAFLGLFDGSDSSLDGGFGCLMRLAVDGSHRLYVLDGCKGSAPGRVDRYSGAGAFQATVDDGTRGTPSAVAVNVATDEVYVAEPGPVGLQIAHYTAGGDAVVYIFDASNVGGVRAMAVDNAGTVFTSDATEAYVEQFTQFDGPTVTSDPCSAVDARSVTLNGTINPEGITSTYHFEYGTGPTYGSRTVGENAGGNLLPVPESAMIDRLQPNKTYHYRLVGTNRSGPIFGADQSCTTTAAPATVDGTPPTVLLPFASAITPRSATLHATVNANNTAAFQTSYYLEYGTTTAYGTQVDRTLCSVSPLFGPPCGADDVSVAAQVPAPSQPGLEPGTTYHFRVVADNGTGGPQRGVDQTFVTAPAAAGGGSDVTTGRATLKGTVNPHGVVTTYHFNYGPTAGYGTSTPEVGAGDGDGDRSVSAPVAGLAASTIYHVQVVATSSDGVVRTGADGLFKTDPAPTAVVMSPTSVSTTTATLAGEIDTHGLPGTYHFEVSSLDSTYTLSTDQRPAAGGSSAQRVAVAASGLPTGKTFVVQLTVSSNDAVEFSDQITFATAPLPQVFPTAPSGDITSFYGCAAPRLDDYEARPKPGETISISGRDLGSGGEAVLGDRLLMATDWSADGFRLRIPEQASGTLALTVDCGHRSNTIAIQVFHEPDNTFAITDRSVTATKATLSFRVPGPGKLESSAPHTTAARSTFKRAGEATITIRLTSTGARLLHRARNHSLRAIARVRFTPAGGRAAAKTVTVTFKAKGRR
jgi:hypothetical protein